MQQNAFSVSVVSWQDYEQSLIALRRKVFIEEQHVSEVEEIDGRDPHYQHLLCRHMATGETVGCARISDQGKIGRVAVLKPFRGFGVGSLLMQHCCQIVLEAGLTPYLDAQLTAIPFYQRLGFEVVGDIFLDANIEHKKMVMATRETTWHDHPGDTK